MHANDATSLAVGMSEEHLTARRVAAVAYINVNVTNLDDTSAFYSALGFEPGTRWVEPASAGGASWGNAAEGPKVDAEHLVMRSPLPHDPDLLLTRWTLSAEGEQTLATDGEAIKEGFVPGIARMALIIPGSLVDEVSRLKALGPDTSTFITSDPITGTPPGSVETSIIALRDPDGTMVELVEIHAPMGGSSKEANDSAFQFLHEKAANPAFQFLHVNINVTRYFESGWPLYESLGFAVVADMGAVDNDFYKSLQIPDPGIARQVTLAKLPSNHSFLLDIIEWSKPATVGKAPGPRQAGMTGITIRLDTVDQVVAMTQSAVALGGQAVVSDLSSWAGAKTRADIISSPSVVSQTVADVDGTLVHFISADAHKSNNGGD